jgi:hypothetical protein
MKRGDRRDVNRSRDAFGGNCGGCGCRHDGYAAAGAAGIAGSCRKQAGSNNRKPGRGPKGEATDYIALVRAVIFLLPFSAQKSDVKLQNHLTPSNKRK